jgi:membrane-associated phospholipid phosphatase
MSNHLAQDRVPASAAFPIRGAACREFLAKIPVGAPAVTASCRIGVVLMVGLLCGARPVNGQREANDDGGRSAEGEHYTPVRWWYPLVAAGGTATIMLIDEPVQRLVQDHQSSAQDDVADITKEFKNPEVFVIIGGGTLATGLVLRKPGVARTGLQIFGAYGVSSAMMIATKWVFGRSRPSDTPDDAFDFNWFNGTQENSFPSGSSAVVFSLATTLSDAIGHPVAAVVLYGGAALNAWSRVYGNRHWVSDVAVGALYGITAAKLVNGRWRIFGLRPPTFLIGPDRSATVGYTVTF